MAAQRKGMLPWQSVTIFLLTCSFTGVFGDVPDDVVYTDLHKTVQLGDSVVLKCQFRGTPLAVYWKKGDDPRTAPNLVSWIPGDPVTGLCEGERPCQIMEMNKNFSLIMKEVSMAEQGRYICRVSSYKGILIHNFTDVKLFSPPQDPVPVIDQCAVMKPSAPQSCSISTSSPINITCLASRYYPDLDLFFLHGLNKITDQATSEWTNHDGTKNKSISIKGSSSDTPYVCVASDIPGSKDQKAATILLPTLSPSVTTTETAVDSRLVKIVVPVSIFVVAGMGVFLVLGYLWRRHQSRGANDIEEAEPMNVLVPGHSNEPPNSQEVKVLVRKLTSRHLRQLAKYIGVHDEDTISRILDGNYGTLFDTESMISEWIEEKRCSIDDVLHIIGGLGMAVHKTGFKRGDFADAEIERIATYLSLSQLKELFGDGGDPAELIRVFVEDSMAKNPKQNYRDKLRTKLQPIGYAGLVPNKVKSKVYLCELLDVAFRLLLEDVYPVAKALGISGETLKKYRIAYASDHLKKGTTAALIKFSEANNHDRRIVREALSSAGYQHIALLLEYGHEISLADEFAVVSKVRDIGDAFPKISQNLGISDRGNTETLVRDWKVMVHPPSYNHRTSLADAVCPVLGAGVAVSILSGQYREHGSESSKVIQRIADGIESFEESLIAKILGVDDLNKLPQQEVITHSHSIDQTDEDRDFNSDGEMGEVAFDVIRASKSALALTLAEILGVTVEQSSPAQYTSITPVLETWVTKLRENPLRKDDRRELSNNLLRTGFKEFAFEIMTGFVPGPADKGNNREGDNGEDKVAGNSNEEQVGEDNRREITNDNGEQVSEEQAPQ